MIRTATYELRREAEFGHPDCTCATRKGVHEQYCPLSKPALAAARRSVHAQRTREPLVNAEQRRALRVERARRAQVNDRITRERESGKSDMDIDERR